MEFNLKMFICRLYNGGGANDVVSFVMDGNRQEDK